MTRYRVAKAPTRQLLLGLAGVLLLLAALDILWLHKVSSEPLEDDAGKITTRGEAWRRTDLIWGTLFVVTGGGLFAAAVAGLASGKPVAEITDDGMALRVAGPQKMVVFRWDDLVDVRPGLVEGDGVRPRRVLIVEVDDPTRYPFDVWGADWVDGVLYVDADSWAEPPEELALRMELELEQWRRRAQEKAVSDQLAADGSSPEVPDEPKSGDPGPGYL